MLALVSLALAYAWPLQGGGGVPNAHYVLVKALADGTPRIDATLGQVGDFSTYDYIRLNGHRYANKAPGFAFLNVPAYTVLRALGMRTTGDPARMLWALGLLAVVLPAVVLAALVRDRSERLEPGFGTAAAVTGGLATLLLPYATIFLSHVLSAALLFGAFALLWREREGPPRLLLVAAAGLLAGYAITTEYPNALGAAILGVYALLRPGRVRRALAFGVGALAGVFPLALYNWWAFGSPAHLSYSGPDWPASELFDTPSPRILLELLFSANGLVVLTPVVACGVVGAVLLLRQGARAEAFVVAGVVGAYLVFNSAYLSPFGGYSPGPRHLIAMLPFLAVALAPAFRALPVTTGALALVSGVVMALVTATHALAGYDRHWLDRLEARETTSTAASLLGVTGWYTILPFFAAAAAAAAFAFAASRAVRPHVWDTLLAGGAVLAWAALAISAPGESSAGEYGAYSTLWVVIGVSALAVLGLRAIRSAV